MVNQAINILQQGGIIAYPTEAVFGLGCDPFNEQAVKKLLTIKQRSVDKGLIILIPDITFLPHYTKNITDEILATLSGYWPGPYTFLLDANDNMPKWVTGNHRSIAIRVSQHPIASQLTIKYQQALISTSANISTEPPAKSYEEVETIFGDKIDLIIPGALGDLSKPTSIYDPRDGMKKIR